MERDFVVRFVAVASASSAAPVGRLQRREPQTLPFGAAIDSRTDTASHIRLPTFE